MNQKRYTCSLFFTCALWRIAREIMARRICQKETYTNKKRVIWIRMSMPFAAQYATHTCIQNALPHTAAHCNTLQLTATHSFTMSHSHLWSHVDVCDTPWRTPHTVHRIGQKRPTQDAPVVSCCHMPCATSRGKMAVCHFIGLFWGIGTSKETYINSVLHSYLKRDLYKSKKIHL